MKDYLEFKNNNCYKCKRPGFYIEYPSGADYTTCPNCKGDIDHMLYNGYNSGDLYNQVDYLNDILEGYYPDIDYYCNNCGILFSSSHQHAENGCTDDLDHSLFITRYQLDNNYYEKIPVFESYTELICILESNRFKILDLSCTCNNINYCSKSNYKKDSIIQETINCKETIQYKTKQINKIISWYKNIKRFVILWKIAEYYTAKKYQPTNALKYINLN